MAKPKYNDVHDGVLGVQKGDREKRYYLSPGD